MQLVGYSIWQRANLHRAKSAIVSERDVTEGIALAEARFHDVVHEPAISGLGLNDIKYLLAMCEDKQQSKTFEIARRCWRRAILAANSQTILTNPGHRIMATVPPRRHYAGGANTPALGGPLR